MRAFGRGRGRGRARGEHWNFPTRGISRGRGWGTYNPQVPFGASQRGGTTPRNFESKKMVRVGQTMYEKKGAALVRVGTEGAHSNVASGIPISRPFAAAGAARGGFVPARSRSRRISRASSRILSRGLGARGAQFKAYGAPRFSFSGQNYRGMSAAWKYNPFGRGRRPHRYTGRPMGLRGFSHLRGNYFSYSASFYRGRTGNHRYGKYFQTMARYRRAGKYFGSKKYVKACKNEKLPQALQAPRSWIVTIAGVKFKKDPHRNALTRVTEPNSVRMDPHVESSGRATHANAQSHPYPISRKFEKSTASEHKPNHGPRATDGDTRGQQQRVRIGGVWYEKSSDGLTLTRVRQNKTLNLKKERVLKQLALAREKRKLAAEERRNKGTKLCTFFTRLGRCSRDKCPFLHDPDRIAVCRMFLNGLCTNEKCPFSHEVAPERMPVCQHFLRGQCTREDCPYRHIKVDPANCSDPLLLPALRHILPSRLVCCFYEDICTCEERKGGAKSFGDHRQGDWTPIDNVG